MSERVEAEAVVCGLCRGSGAMLVDGDPPYTESAKQVPCPDCAAADATTPPPDTAGLRERLGQYEGRQWETTACYNGLRDEAAATIARLERERDEALARYDAAGAQSMHAITDKLKAEARADKLAEALRDCRAIAATFMEHAWAERDEIQRRIDAALRAQDK